MSEKKFLKVPGAWLEKCGYGTEDRIFPVLDVREFARFGGGLLRTDTFATVDRDGFRWTVHVECRKAEFVSEGEVKS